MAENMSVGSNSQGPTSSDMGGMVPTPPSAAPIKPGAEAPPSTDTPPPPQPSTTGHTNVDSMSSATSSPVATQTEEITQKQTTTQKRINLMQDSTASLKEATNDFVQKFKNELDISEKTGDVEFFAGNQAEQMISQLMTITMDRKEVILSQKTVDNLSMGLPAIGPPMGGSTIDAKMTGGLSINKFLAGNAFTAFLIAFQDMMQALKEMQKAEGQQKINGLEMTASLAKDAGAAAMASAEAEAMKEFIAAGMAAVQIAGAAAGLAGTAKAYRSAKVDVAEQKQGLRDAKDENELNMEGKQSVRNKTTFDNTKPPSDENPQYVHKDNTETPPTKFTNKKAEAAREDTFLASQAKEARLKDEKALTDKEKTLIENDNKARTDAAIQYQRNTDELDKLNSATNMHVFQQMRPRTDEWSMRSQVITQMGQSVGSVLQGFETLEKGKQDALQQYIKGYEQVNATVLDSANKSFQQAAEDFRSLCETLTKISGENARSFGWTSS